MGDSNRKKFEPGFAIVRICCEAWIPPPAGATSPEQIEQALGYAVNPIRVLRSRDEALAEARRLNGLNGGKGFVYFVAYTRVESSRQDSGERAQ